MSKRPWEFEEPICAEIGNIYFYLDDKDERDPNSISDYNIAKSLCSQCLHRVDCAEWGIYNEAHGVWGGMTPKERAYQRQIRGLRLDLS